MIEEYNGFTRCMRMADYLKATTYKHKLRMKNIRKHTRACFDNYT